MRKIVAVVLTMFAVSIEKLVTIHIYVYGRQRKEQLEIPIERLNQAIK